MSDCPICKRTTYDCVCGVPALDPAIDRAAVDACHAEITRLRNARSAAPEPAKCAMTISLSEKEMDALESMARAKDTSKTATIRQALRLMSYIEARLNAGDKMAWIGRDGKPVEAVIVGCGNVE